MTHKGLLYCFRDRIAHIIISLVEYSNKFATYSGNDNVIQLLENFARNMYVWRQPFPKFRQSQVSARCIWNNLTFITFNYSFCSKGTSRRSLKLKMVILAMWPI